MIDYEKLGAFYLGREYDLGTGSMASESLLYDSRDLTTHAVIIGMTGSGKTGLGITLLEEALIDNIPVIAIDPKGDLTNLMLTFPDLAPSDFQPWIDPAEAANAGESIEEFAGKRAATWKKGLKEWDQDGERIRRMREAVEMSLYTPGSTSGRPVSVLRSLDAPPAAIIEDPDLFRDSVSTIATSLLNLAGIDEADLSREHTLVSTILSSAWSEGRAVDLAGLIRGVQQPPFTRIGVLDLESYFPSRERFQLATKLNHLLASPSFAAWSEGDPLDPAALFRNDAGQPRASIFTISHLSDRERMFFVTNLLDRLIGWMRSQPGTPSLRAILYIDEVFGYLPPVAEPPSKKPLLTLLKQARAFGIGVVLATQNPVDLDYKALSNAGTWFLGRLQTERDKERVMDGLRGVRGSERFTTGELERTLSSLPKRVFLLHNVHENAPVTFHTRWAMSYLAGPLTRNQIRDLTGSSQSSSAPAASPPTGAVPVMPPGISAWYLDDGSSGAAWDAGLLATAEVHYTDRRLGKGVSRDVALFIDVVPDRGQPDWDDAEEIDIDDSDLAAAPPESRPHEQLPGGALDEANHDKWRRAAARTIRHDFPYTLYTHAGTKLTSDPDETEADFRGRITQALREKRDEVAAGLRTKYDKKLRTLEARYERARQAVERETDQARERKLDTAVSFGTAVLGAFLGRKGTSTFGTAFSRAGRIKKESADIERANERSERVKLDIEALDRELAEELESLDLAMDPAAIELEEVTIRPKASDITIRRFGILWR